MASERVRAEWRARIAAEYTSAAITQQVTLWLIQVAAPPELIADGLAIVADELEHSRLSHEVYTAAGGTEPPAIDRNGLGLPRTHATVEEDLLAAIVRVFCLGETVAVPLFSHLRAPCTEAVARAALDRILRDEVRHREFGWDALDWLSTVMQIEPFVMHGWPQWKAELERSYGIENPAVSVDDGAITDDDRSWGLAAPRDYAEILARTIDRDYRPRFDARGITI
ncbi:MAG: ferritin-like domain-containing protein [Kofleriaceae bacterium]